MVYTRLTKHPRRLKLYQTYNCVLILQVNINVNFQIKLKSSIFKANVSIFTKLNVAFYISLIPKAIIQITATIDQCADYTPETREQIYERTKAREVVTLKA